MSFFTILTLGISGSFWLGSFMNEFKEFKESSLTPLEVEKVLYHEKNSDDVKAYIALVENTEASKKVLSMADSLKKDISRLDTVTTRNATTIYQMKQGQAEFFAQVIRELRRNQ